MVAGEVAFNCAYDLLAELVTAVRSFLGQGPGSSLTWISSSCTTFLPDKR